MEKHRRIVVIGAGNVATHLARAFDAHSHVVQVMSRNIAHACILARYLSDCEAVDSFDNIVADADFYIIAVNDDAISAVSAAMPAVRGIVAHTSGSTPLQALSVESGRRGVIYPLQTFSRDAEVKVADVPFFIEGSDEGVQAELEALAASVSEHVYRADSASRASLHIAAVFACNFFNHLLCHAERLLAADGYPLSVLEPLLHITLDKALAIGPRKAQTGPAARGDLDIMRRHMQRLDGDSRDIYQLLSGAIMRQRAVDKC